MIISIASGKGGTGKTLIATSLALSLAGQEQVQLVDCDVEEPNVHVILKPVISQSESVTIAVLRLNKEKCNYCGKCAQVCSYNAIAVFPDHVMLFTELCHGCGACSYLCPEGALYEGKREVGVMEKGRSNGIDFIQGKLNIGESMPMPAIREVKKNIDRERTVIIDVSPGTSCSVVGAVVDSDFCILVTEPTPFGLNDLSLAVDMVNKLKIPCGVIINRDGSGDMSVDRYCREKNIPILLRIPLDIEIARLYSSGITLVKGMPQWRESFIGLYRDIEKRVVAETKAGGG
ncbi:ATP-binding protein [Chloroflexota bacterium]